MSLTDKIKKLTEGRHHNSKVRDTHENKITPAKVKLTLKEGIRMVECMMNENHPSPCPCSKEDSKAMEESIILMKQSMMRMNDAKAKRKK